MQYFNAHSSSQGEDGDDLEAEAMSSLARAEAKPVAFAIRSNIQFDPSQDDQSPIRSHTISFAPNDFLHIKEKFNDDWWIGRLVREDCGLGFIPSPIKVESLRVRDANLFQFLASEEQIIGGGGGNQLRRDKKRLFKRFQPQPYDVVPAIRPVILIGPSLKGFEVTDMMQKAIFVFLKERFKDRIIITHVTADISLAKEVEQADPVGGIGCRRSGLIDRSVRSEANRRLSSHLTEVTLEIERVFELAKTMQLLVLDCDTINHPDQIAKTSLAPILVYLKMASPKVLQRLIKSRGRGQARYMSAQMSASDRLNQMPNDAFDVVLEENQLEEACDHLARYLENYWRAVQSSRNQSTVSWEESAPSGHNMIPMRQNLGDGNVVYDHNHYHHDMMNLPNYDHIENDLVPFQAAHVDQNFELNDGYLLDRSMYSRPAA